MTAEQFLKFTFEVPNQYSDIFSGYLYTLGLFDYEIRDSDTLAKSTNDCTDYIFTMKKHTTDEFLTNLFELCKPLEEENKLSCKDWLKVEDLRDENWGEIWKSKFDIVKIGDFVIKPHWLEYTPLENETLLHIDPGMAFGTGLHETTNMAANCLINLKKNGESYSRILDMGTGTGILAMIACSLWPNATAHGVEIDEDALLDAEKIINQNGFSGKITLGNSNPVDENYDLVIANINAKVLMELSSVLKGYSSSKIILTGITSNFANDVKNTYALPIEDKQTANEWVLFVLLNGKENSSEK